MKKLLIALLILGLAVILPAPIFAQTAMTTTFLSGAVTSLNVNQVTVNSATGITANVTQLVIDYESMRVTAVSGTTITVSRGTDGTSRRLHENNALVWVGPPEAFPPDDPSGACTASTLPYLPRVNARNGNIWNCSNIGQWSRVNFNQMQASAWPITIINNAAYTALLQDYVIIQNSVLSAGITVTLPSITGIDGNIKIIKNINGANQTITITGVNGQNIGGAQGALTTTIAGGTFRTVWLISYSNFWYTLLNSL